MSTWCADAVLAGTPQLSYTVRPWVKSGVPLPMQMLAHSPGLAMQLPYSPTTPTVRTVESNANPTLSQAGARDAPTPSSIDTTSSHSSLRRHTHKSAPLSLHTRRGNSPSRRSIPTRRPRGDTASTTPHTPDHSRDGADSVLSFTPSMRSQQLANWFSGFLGR